MKSYLYLNQSEKGQLAISNYVFTQIALQSLKNLSEGQLKDGFVYDDKMKKMNVDTMVDKNGKVIINLSITGYTGTDMQKICKQIQEEVYENVLEMFEISKISVNVTILGMTEKK